MMKRMLIAACAVAVTVGGLIPIGVSPAAADPARAGMGSGFGASIVIAGQPAINAAGLATATLPPGEDADNSLLLVPLAPIAVSGTAVGAASANQDSVVLSSLDQVSQPTPGPYNVGGLGLVEGLALGIGVGEATVPLVSASAVRGEAVGVCRGTTASYSAASEIIDLNIGGTAVALNGPITGLIDTLNTALAPLNQVISIQRDQKTVTSEGATVSALRIRLLSLTGTPLLDVALGRAEASGLECGPPIPECSDTEDNDGDGVIDRNDPGCITNGVFDPNDDDERNECIDGIDNTDPEDTLVDFGSDPGCTDPQDDNETDDRPDGGGGSGQILARTGGDDSSSLPLAAGFGVLAFGAMVLRRRSQASR